MVWRNSAADAVFTFSFALGALPVVGEAAAAGLAAGLGVFVGRFSLPEPHAATSNGNAIEKDTSVKTLINFRGNISSPFVQIYRSGARANYTDLE
jgi:hypothetical protein